MTTDNTPTRIKVEIREIAADIDLWNEYFNVSALMTDNDFHALTYRERVQMLIDAFDEDEDEDEDSDQDTGEST